MKDLAIKYLGTLVLEQSSKGELINKVLQLQERDKELMDKLTNLYQTKREAGESHKEIIEEYKKRIEELVKKLVHYEVVSEEYKRVADLKLGNTYNINATWIDKIVFVLKAAGRPLRSSEIVDILLKNDMMFRTLNGDHQKSLSAHLTKALKYGRIIGTKQKGQNGYIYDLPEN